MAAGITWTLSRSITMEQDILTESYHDGSQRHGMLSCEHHSAWLYLHKPSDSPNRSGPVEFTAFAFNLVAPITGSEVQGYRPSPPPIVDSFASDFAVCANPNEYTWEIAWSNDGHSVALHRDGEPWCFITPGAKYGFSRAISTDGPWGKPWCNDSFAQTDWGSAENTR